MAVLPQALAQWQPGNIVCWKMPGGGDHTGLVSDYRDESGIPLVVDNRGRYEEEYVLTQWPIAGHYRYPPPPAVFSVASRHNRKNKEKSKQPRHRYMDKGAPF